MIFDGFENDEDLFRALPSRAAPSPPDCDISLDDLILARQERQANRDFSHCYETLQMQVATHPRRSRPEGKENLEHNVGSNQKRTGADGAKERPTRKVSGCVEPSQLSRPQRVETQSPLPHPGLSQPSIVIDLEKVNPSINFKPSLAILAALESEESLDESPADQSLEDLLGNPRAKFTSPLPKRRSPHLLRKRSQLQNSSGNSPPVHQSPPESGKNLRSLHKTSGTDSKLCRLLFKDPHLSMQDVHLLGGQRKPKTVVKRSFSVNSIAREIFRATQAADHPSFHTIHSMDYIGTSNIDLDDCLGVPCGVCDKFFRVNDVVARTHSCRHVFHKQCLDERLFATFVAEECLLCPTCQGPI